jgi:hypothetical protein
MRAMINLGVDQPQVTESEIGHGAAHRTDIAAALRFHQYNGDIIKLRGHLKIAEKAA